MTSTKQSFVIHDTVATDYQIMKITHADGSTEDKPDNYRQLWSPAEILAIKIPPEHRPMAGNPYHQFDRRSPAQLKTENQKRTAIARQAKADKRKLKSKT